MPTKPNLWWCSLLALGFTACGSQSGEETPPQRISDPPRVAQLISDQTHNSGRPGFLFLPPTVLQAPPRFTGAFDPSVKAVARVCQGVGACDDRLALAVFTAVAGTGGGPLAKLRAVPELQAYTAMWDTRRCANGPCSLVTGGAYRLHVAMVVSPGVEVELGWADLQVVNFMPLPKLATTNYSPLIRNLPYVIAFRIEKASDLCASVVCIASDQCHSPGVCDPARGTCSNPAKADGAACNDGNACTQVDACQAGTCVGTSPVVCTAQDQCHATGTCDPGSGICSSTPHADGTLCDDGNYCTRSDYCLAGMCVGDNPVTCTVLDQCHDVGTCDPASGLCSDRFKPDDTACSDGSACTLADVCRSGTCVGLSPVVCAPADQCHAGGTCDPISGACSAAPLPDGTACFDGNLCTRTDACQSGTCVGSDSVTCVALDQCHGVGSCDPGTGTCSEPLVPDNTACSDGNACTLADVCRAGRCTGGPTTTCPTTTECNVSKGCNLTTGLCEVTWLADGSQCSGGTCMAGECRSSAPREVRVLVDASTGAELVVSSSRGDRVSLTIPSWGLAKGEWVTMRSLDANPGPMRESELFPGVQIEPGDLQLLRPGRLSITLAQPNVAPGRFAIVSVFPPGSAGLLDNHRSLETLVEANLNRLGAYEVVDVVTALRRGEFVWPPSPPGDDARALLDAYAAAYAMRAIAAISPCMDGLPCPFAEPSTYISEAGNYLRLAAEALLAVAVPGDPNLYLRDLYDAGAAISLESSTGAVPAISARTTFARLGPAMASAFVGGYPDLGPATGDAESQYCQPNTCSVACGDCPDVGSWRIYWMNDWSGSGSFPQENPGYWSQTVSREIAGGIEGLAVVHYQTGFVSSASISGRLNTHQHWDGTYVVPPTCPVTARFYGDQWNNCAYSGTTAFENYLSQVFRWSAPLVSYLPDPFHKPTATYGQGSCSLRSPQYDLFCNSYCGAGPFFTPATTCVETITNYAPPPSDQPWGTGLAFAVTATPMLPNGPGTVYSKVEHYFGFIDPLNTIPFPGTWQVAAEWQGPVPRYRCKHCPPATECTTGSTCDPRTGQCVGGGQPRAGSCSRGACFNPGVCEAGKCNGSPITCAAKDRCHNPGTCTEASGSTSGGCSNPEKPVSQLVQELTSECESLRADMIRICTTNSKTSSGWQVEYVYGSNASGDLPPTIECGSSGCNPSGNVCALAPASGDGVWTRAGSNCVDSHSCAPGQCSGSGGTCRWNSECPRGQSCIGAEACISACDLNGGATTVVQKAGDTALQCGAVSPPVSVACEAICTYCQ